MKIQYDNTLKPVLETTCIKQSTALRDHRYDTNPLLTLSQTTNFRLFQTEKVCRRTILNLIKMLESYFKG